MNKFKQALIDGTLYTRRLGKVSKLIDCKDLDNRPMFEVYVEGCPWCIVTVYASNGKFDVNATDNDKDEVDLIIKQ